MKEKVVLAYSGGLDTTAIIPWLKENYDCEVICCCIDVGQKEELDGLEERAKACGASKLYIKNVVDEYVENYIMPTVQADAVFEYKYLLGTATARPLIAKVLVDVARKEGAVAICHGATGKGNDQIRFELGIKALAPDLKIIAAWRDPKWTMDSRESEIEYCRAHGINLPFSADNSYSRDRNIWHISHEGLELEDPSCAPNYDHLLVLSNSPEKAPEEDVHLSIDWEKGVPVALNGEKLSQREILEKLNEIGGQHGIGIIDIVENRVVGMKSRGVYETPGGTILMEAHQQLEELILDRETLKYKRLVSVEFAELVYAAKWFSPLREAHQQLEELILDRETLKYKRLVSVEFAELVYAAKWFSPLREALTAFVDKTQEYVTGTTNFRLYKGNIIKEGTTSPYSLYDEDIASFKTGDLYDHHDAEGFITLYGLSTKVRAMKLNNKK